MTRRNRVAGGKAKTQPITSGLLVGWGNLQRLSAADFLEPDLNNLREGGLADRLLLRITYYMATQNTYRDQIQQPIVGMRIPGRGGTLLDDVSVTASSVPEPSSLVESAAAWRVSFGSCAAK
jgi:hypothetical protein